MKSLSFFFQHSLSFFDEWICFVATRSDAAVESRLGAGHFGSSSVIVIEAKSLLYKRRACLLRSLLLLILPPIFLSKQTLIFSRKLLLRILQFSLFSNDNDPNVQILPFGYRNLSVRGESKPNVTTMARATKTI